jgi:hypothetical protein
MIFLLYGQPGTGKSTLATGIAREAAGEGRRVAANYPIDFAPASVRPNGPLARAFCHVLPSRPTLADLRALGVGWAEGEEGREDRAGLLIVDEAGPWLSSRNWQAAERQEIIDWFLHSRKLGWDVVLIAQAPGLLDKQVREAVIEGYARCRRTDRLKVAGVSMPRVHIAIARYGNGPNDPMIQRWIYRGQVEHRMFQSYAMFNVQGEQGAYCTLPPSITKWAGYESRWVALRRGANIFGLFALAVLAYVLQFLFPPFRRVLHASAAR